MDKQLRRILDLVRKTGDRMVVTDANGEDVYVVMGLDEYEGLVSARPAPAAVDPGGSDGRDWWEPEETDRSAPSSVMTEAPSAPADIWEAMKPAGEAGETWDLGKLSEAEKVDLESQYRAYQKTKEIESVSPAEPTSSAEKPDEDFGEEQFYLEPVE